MKSLCTKTEDYVKYCIAHWLLRRDVRKMLRLQTELIEMTLNQWWTFHIHWLLIISLRKITLRKDLWEYALTPKANLSVRFRHNNIRYDKHRGTWK